MKFFKAFLLVAGLLLLVALVIYLPPWIHQDRYLDAGGKYDPTTKQCELSTL